MTEVIDKQVAGVSFGFYTADDVLALSAAAIVHPHTFDSMHNPVPSGLYDPRLGPLTPADKCPTCGQGLMQCLGHMGHIRLTMPVYHPVLFDLLCKVMRGKCWWCHQWRVARVKVDVVRVKLELIEAAMLLQAQGLEQLEQSSAAATGEMRKELRETVRRDKEKELARRRKERLAAQNGKKAGKSKKSGGGEFIDDEAAEEEEDEEDDGERMEDEDGHSSHRPTPSSRETQQLAHLAHLSSAARNAYNRHVSLYGSPPAITSAAIAYRSEVIATFLSSLTSQRRCVRCGGYSPRLRKDGHSKLFRLPLVRKEREANEMSGKWEDEGGVGGMGGQAGEVVPGMGTGENRDFQREARVVRGVMTGKQEMNGHATNGKTNGKAADKPKSATAAKRAAHKEKKAKRRNQQTTDSDDDTGGSSGESSGSSSSSSASDYAADESDSDAEPSSSLLADDTAASTMEVELAREGKRVPILMFPTEVEKHLELLWQKERSVMQHIWGCLFNQPRSSSTQPTSTSSALTHAMFFIRVLGVPPSRFRPPSLLNGMESDHPHNTYLKSILDFDSRIAKLSGARPGEQPQRTIAANDEVSEAAALDWSILIEQWLSLQEQVNVLLDSSKASQPNAPQDGIRQTFEKKEGLFRRNMMGKRVNYAARSVISPDPFLNTNEIGVPEMFATQLTFPEPVTAFNVQQLRQAVINGPDVHPGANGIEDERGVVISLAHKTREQRVALSKTLMTGASAQKVGKQAAPVGVVTSGLQCKRVMRHIRSGDAMLVNRQPTLHKPSMMTHRVRVLHGRNKMWQTIRMHYANCNTYNADFDGDEMNLHVPQCFPELDTRVLTDSGFLFLDEIEARLARGESVLYACYQKSRLMPASSDDMLKGELVYRSGTLVYSTPPRELIVFSSSPGEARRWMAQSVPYGNTAAAADEHVANDDIETDDGVGCISRHVSLRVTPQHNMYVQLDSRCTPPEKVHASTLLSDCSCPPTQLDEPECIHRRASVTMLACADAGRQPSFDERSDVRATVQGRLGLTDVQFPAFLELFGFWLARGGAMNYRDSAVKLSQANADDVTFVDETLAAVGLRPGQFYRHEQPLPCRASKPMSTTTWQIADKGWFNFFDRQSDGAAGLPRWILHCLTPDEARKVVSGLWRANETWSTQEKSVRTCDIALRDQLMQLLLHCGFTASTQLIHHAGTICGYLWWDTAADATMYSVKEVVAMSVEEHALYRPIESAQASWEVTWADTSSSMGKEACWPSMLRQQAVSSQTYSPERDGRIWCVTVDHDEHLIVAQRAQRHDGIVTQQSRPVIVGQSQLARAEAYHISNTDHQYLVPTDGSPLRGLIQDNVLTGVMLTQLDTWLTRAQFQQLLFCCIEVDPTLALPTPKPAILKPVEMFSGKQIISTLLNLLTHGRPPLNLQSKAKVPVANWAQHKEEATIIVRGNDLVTGALDKSQFGDAGYGLVHAVYEMYGANTAGQLLSTLGRLFTLYLQTQAFTCGIDDMLIVGESEQKRHALIQESINTGMGAAADFAGVKADSDTPTAINDALQRLVTSDPINVARLDATMKGALNPFTSDIIRSCLPSGQYKAFPYNGMSLMTLSGAKGSAVNFSQISCLLGQQELEGKRVPMMATGKTLPSFRRYDPQPRAGGYVTDRFLTGIRPQEYFFHCMAGREGLIDTAVKTSRSGYLQRCLIKHLESLTVNYDYTVRDSDLSVVQFHYGEDSIDIGRTSYLEKFSFLTNNWLTLIHKLHPPAAINALDTRSVEQYLRKQAKRKLQPDPLLSVFSPGANMGAVSESYTAAVEEYIASDPDQLFSSTAVSSLNRSREQPAITADKFRAVMSLNYLYSLVHPGESVGILAAQSVGEPSTQMTLNTFHLAGHGGANVTLGIPRLREIIMTASQRIRTPIMELPLLGKGGKEAAEDIAARLTRLTLSQFLYDVAVSESVDAKEEGASAWRLYRVRLEFPDMNSKVIDDARLSWTDFEQCFGHQFVTRLNAAVKKEVKAMSKSHAFTPVIMRGKRGDRGEGEAREEAELGGKMRGRGMRSDEDAVTAKERHKHDEDVSYAKPDEEDLEIIRRQDKEMADKETNDEEDDDELETKVSQKSSVSRTDAVDGEDDDNEVKVETDEAGCCRL